eukprot:TRINITY_DN16007_c0_g1_i1.p1 TRINITY_DN16007_c0_g1~~TRINITY_DN16007_c0_g1_i1.p1  ORF type:complete len:548 (+),score=78.11 TRINITY_DN16007_c0_g1_i1:262-1905(+)
MQLFRQNSLSQNVRSRFQLSSGKCRRSARTAGSRESQEFACFSHLASSDATKASPRVSETLFSSVPSFAQAEPITSQRRKSLLRECSKSMSVATKRSSWAESLQIFSTNMATSGVLRHESSTSISDTCEQKIINRIRPDIVCINAAIAACEAGRLWPNALEFLSSAHLWRLTPNLITLTSAMSACRKGHEWQRALGLFESLGNLDLRPDAATFGAAISSSARGRCWSLALALLEQARFSSSSPNAVTYNAVISACEKGRRWQVALAMFHDMTDHSLRPTLITFNTTLSSCEMARQWEVALQLLEEHQEGRAVDSDLKQHRGTSGELLAASGNIGAVDMSTRRQVEPQKYRFELDLVSLNVAIGALGAAQSWEKSLLLFHSLRGRGFSPTNTSHTTTIGTLERASRWQEALEILRISPKPVDDSSLEIAAVACARASCWTKAIHLLSLGGFKLYKNVSFRYVRQACEAAGVAHVLLGKNSVRNSCSGGSGGHHSTASGSCHSDAGVLWLLREDQRGVRGEKWQGSTEAETKWCLKVRDRLEATRQVAI